MTILLRQKPATFHVGRQAHRVPDEWLRTAMRTEFTQEYGPHWLAVVIQANGAGATVPSTPWLPWFVPEEQIEFLKALILTVNLQCNPGGVWYGAWLGPNDFCLHWRDGDGDLHCTYAEDQPWPRVKRNGLFHYASLMAQAIEQMREVEQHVLPVRADQKRRFVQGETVQ